MAVDLATQKQLLDDERERLQKELGKVARANPAQPGTWDSAFPIAADVMDGISHADREEDVDRAEEFETNIAEQHALEERFHEVLRALGRIADGNYGICAACQNPIPEDRLAANPAAEYDMEHQPKN